MQIDISFDPETFSGQVPLFPLPGSILLPGTLIPLHVFEPRYRAMIEDAIAGERLIAPALLKPGYEGDYYEAPPIEPAVCIGRLVFEERLLDGRWNILLVGVARAQVVSEDHSRAYRLATVEPLTEGPDLAPAEQERQASELARFLAKAPARLVKDGDAFQEALQRLSEGSVGALGLSTLVDIASDGLFLGLSDRLQLLQTGGLSERVELLNAVVRKRTAELEQIRRESPWPPRFSRN